MHVEFMCIADSNNLEEKGKTNKQIWGMSLVILFFLSLILKPLLLPEKPRPEQHRLHHARRADGDYHKAYQICIIYMDPVWL